MCRLPDCFAPNPKSPIDVFDQVTGTHEWAERLRRDRYFYLKNKDENSHETNENFVKRPWYQPTLRAPSPQGTMRWKRSSVPAMPSFWTVVIEERSETI